jgi:hypothetical protein
MKEEIMRSRYAIGLTLALTALAALPAAASAEERSCRGTIGPRTVDNLRVPQGARCTLQRTRVKGTIKVERNGVLSAVGVRVNGNVQGENARRVAVRSSRIGGSFQVVQGWSAGLDTSRVTGTVLLDENRGPSRVADSRINGDVQVFQNAGAVAIWRNRIGANLQCKQNRSLTGGRNVVHGKKEDQCARF